MPGGVAGAQPKMPAPYADLRPTWMHSCESCRKLIKTNEAKLNCMSGRWLEIQAVGGARVIGERKRY